MDSKDKKSASVSSLGPGFRFHPTDEELVRYYLRRKACGKSFRFDAISEIDIYKVEPWDLPSMSNLKTRDLEWYFFSMLDKKYGNGARTNRATEKGYWKTTGKDRTVYHKSQIVGMKKTLVYHIGRAPKGERSNWVMHEYRLADLELQKAGINQDAIVLCRVFQKSGSGPKNGEQYGAPFVEEEWEDDELELVPKQEAAEEVDFGDDFYLDGHDLEQILGTDIPSDIAPLPLNTNSIDNTSYEEETSKSSSGAQQRMVDMVEHKNEPEKHDDQNLYDLPASYDTVVKPVRHEYMVESSEPGNFEDVDYLLDEPFLDASDNVQYSDGGFVETNDLSNPGAADTSTFDALEEYLAFFDANDDNSQYSSCDLSKMMGSEDLISDHAFLTETVDEGTQQATVSSEQLIDNTNNDAPSSSNKQELAKCQSDFQYPFIEQASRMLGNFPAPMAFASEFPSKNATLLNSASSSAHITAGMIQIRNLTVNGNGTDQSFMKNQNFNIVLSFGLSRGVNGSINLESRVNLLPGKAVSATSWGWFDFIFFWVLILSMSFKIGTFLCQVK
ncbi:NAC domain-containing protein 53-like isoform X2 [Olea europaea var. sylvestris]|uniref:NAC domain-containing protein 53-like isoform X2 n=1 Tax=Olea europaea var. sylvestris TaxID=158386 RepID=UPI000C1D2FE6|nr:NAC domain-containing protein 53-like isoform X2 [Olea europaea var. sylvestris]